MNILIADDDPVIVRLLSATLQMECFTTFVAFDVVQATQTIRHNRIDAVILDIKMPGGSGFDILYRLKQSARTNQIRVLVVSGTADEQERERARQMGAEAIFKKPPDLEAIVSLLRTPPVTAELRDAITPQLHTINDFYCGA